MKTATTTAAQLEETGRRLDASYHASDGVRAYQFILAWAGKAVQTRTTASLTLREPLPVYGKRRAMDTLADVCVPGGVFIPGRFKRIYVDDPAHGEPWLSPSDMLKADLTGLRLISRKFTSAIETLRVRQGWILLSRSGTIGNMAYVRSDMDGLVGSDDIIRIIADPDKIPSGYLCAWLSSPLARALIEQKTYGAVVPHIEAHHVVDLPVPRLDGATEQRIHELIERAAQSRVNASLLQKQAQAATSAAVGVNLLCVNKLAVTSLPMSSLRGRFEANFHVAQVTAENVLSTCSDKRVAIGELLRDIFYLGKLHRVFVNNAVEGVTLLSISDVQKAKLTSGKYVSKTFSRNVNQAMLEKGWVLVSRVGTPGIVIYTRREMEGMAGTDHLVRLVCDHSKVLPGYLYSFLCSGVGQVLLTGSAHGSVQLVLPPEYIAQIRVPLPSRQSQEAIHNAIEQSAETLTQASEAEDQAQILLAQALGAKTAS